MKKNTNNLPLVVIFGRANTGKSTLFNALTEKRQALISDIAGTTRDSNIGEVEWRGNQFTLVDTGGIIQLKSDNLHEIEKKVQDQAKDYIKKADLILFLVDNKTGLLPQDKEMALFLKKEIKNPEKILIVANKTDNPKTRPNAAEFNKLSFGEPLTISAATGSGTGDLLDVIINKINKKKTKAAEKETETEKPEAIKVCIVGQPNVGKSSLLNSLLGYERVIISPEPHTTREPQDTEIIYNDKKIILVDTAGINKKWNKGGTLEKKGIEKSLEVLKRADIALFVIDISKELTHQDQKIAEEIITNGDSLIIIANKWDLVGEKDTKKFTNYIYNAIPFASWAPIHFASALTKGKVNKIFDIILKAAEARKISVSDSQLNKLLSQIVKTHRPAKAKGIKHPHIYEFRQTRVRPPKFEIRIGSKDSLHYSYLRFISNRLREKYGFFASPISVRTTRNRRVHGKNQ